MGVLQDLHTNCDPQEKITKLTNEGVTYIKSVTISYTDYAIDKLKKEESAAILEVFTSQLEKEHSINNAGDRIINNILTASTTAKSEITEATNLVTTTNKSIKSFHDTKTNASIDIDTHKEQLSNRCTTYEIAFSRILQYIRII